MVDNNLAKKEETKQAEKIKNKSKSQGISRPGIPR